MNIYELVTQFTDNGERDGSVVDKHTTLSRAADFASQDGVLWIIVDVIVGEKRLQLIVADVKMCLYGTFLAFGQ